MKTDLYTKTIFTFITVFLAVLALKPGVPIKSVQAASRTYEYTWYRGLSGNDDAQVETDVKRLNAYGKEGWEVVGLSRLVGGGSQPATTLYLTKR